MKRRRFIKQAALAAAGMSLSWEPWFTVEAAAGTVESLKLDPALAQNWLKQWEEHILGEIHHRYCDSEMGEEIGWLMSPFLNGFYYGYMGTRETKWVEHLVDWADSWIKRSVQEPDGFVGWPKRGTGGVFEKDLLTDSLLGEAMGLRPLVLMAGEIARTPELNQYRDTTKTWLELAGKIFEKWDQRGCWREVKGGGLWVVPAFGIDEQTGNWTDGYATRNTSGFSNPDNKQNYIARWLLAMHDVTRKPVYRERAEKWFQLMKSRMKTRENGKYFVWNYWEPAGPWDYKSDGAARHWVGVHPNGGYYTIDIEGIVAAYEHGTVFTRSDIDRLVATNRDFMWNHQMNDAKFQRIDGGQPDSRWENTPGVLWTALVPYDETLRKVFLANNKPASWGGLIVTPWFLALNRIAAAPKDG